MTLVERTLSGLNVRLNEDELLLLIAGPRETKEALAKLSPSAFKLRTGHSGQEMSDFLRSMIDILDEKPSARGGTKHDSLNHDGWLVQFSMREVHMIVVSLRETLNYIEEWEFELLTGVSRSKGEAFLAEWLEIVPPDLGGGSNAS